NGRSLGEDEIVEPRHSSRSNEGQPVHGVTPIGIGDSIDVLSEAGPGECGRHIADFELFEPQGGGKRAQDRRLPLQPAAPTTVPGLLWHEIALSLIEDEWR